MTARYRRTDKDLGLLQILRNLHRIDRHEGSVKFEVTLHHAADLTLQQFVYSVDPSRNICPLTTMNSDPTIKHPDH